MKPIFILSLPRAGSTWLQRIVSSAPSVATAPEPWLLLCPLMPLMQEGHTFSHVGMDHIHLAAEDVLKRLHGGRESYYAATRAFTDELYRGLAGTGDFSHFVDKTPRYHFIAQDIHRMYPDAKFIYLWRNPLAVAGSVYETWNNGRTGITRSHIDLFLGLRNLVAAHKAFAGNALTVKYEDLVADSANVIPKISAYLEIDIPMDMIAHQENAATRGNMGDPLAIHNQGKADEERLDSWTRALRPLMRRRWAKRYLEWIGEEAMFYMGYDYHDTLSKLGSRPATLQYVVGDCLKVAGGAILNYTSGNLISRGSRPGGGTDMKFPYT